MQIKIILTSISFLLVFVISSFAQEDVNLVSAKFTYNNNSFPQGEQLRKTFERVASKPKYPFRFLDRENLDLIITNIQEEQNLRKDFNLKQLEELEVAGIDFLVLANVSNIYGQNEYYLEINLVKTSGDDVTLSLPMNVKLLYNELTNYEVISKKIEEEMDVFVGSYWNSFRTKFSSTIIDRNKKQDSLLSVYGKSIEEKELRIRSLEEKLKRINAIQIKIMVSIDSVSQKKDTIMRSRYGYSQLFFSELSVDEDIFKIYDESMEFNNNEVAQQGFRDNNQFVIEIYYHPIMNSMIGTPVESLRKMNSVFISLPSHDIYKRGDIKIELELIVNGYKIIAGHFPFIQIQGQSNFYRMDISNAIVEGIEEFINN